MYFTSYNFISYKYFYTKFNRIPTSLSDISHRVTNIESMFVMFTEIYTEDELELVPSPTHLNI